MIFHLAHRIRTHAKDAVKDFARIVGCAAAYIIYDYNVGGFRSVTGPSMRPTLNATPLHIDLLDRNNSVPCNDIFYFSRRFNLSRGDVVYLTSPRKSSTGLVKRVVALPGDTVQPLGIPGQKEGPSPVTLSEQQVWVESDAGPGYSDSDLFGPVDLSLIHGKLGWAITPTIDRANFLGYRTIDSELSPERLARVSPGGKQ